MKPWLPLLALLALLLTACQTPPPAVPLLLPPLQQAAGLAPHPGSVLPRLPPPDGLRPCCAFGYNLGTQFLGIPVPWYRISNVLAASETGVHHYNNQPLYTLATLAGINGEHNGLIYTQRGGFIDLAHVRDTADNTLWLFSQIWPDMGKNTRIALPAELGERVIELSTSAPPDSATDRFNLAARLAAHLAFRLAAWHEIAQWYGFRSVAGFSEGVSAFSPEDLYSNLLGARIALDLLNAGSITSLSTYERAMAQAIPAALSQLGAGSPSVTRFQLDMLDGIWWNSHCRLPEKFLLRQRNYSTSDRRWPSRPPERVAALYLTLPAYFQGQPLSQFARLRILPGKAMARLPPPARAYGYRDFAWLARQAQAADRQQLSRVGTGCQ